MYYEMNYKKQPGMNPGLLFLDCYFKKFLIFRMNSIGLVNTMDKKAFTLVEIIIVVAILSLLLAVAVPNMIKARGTAIEDTCRANRGEIAKTIST